VWFAPAVPVRINWTTSAPLGLYSTHRISNVVRDDLVALCLPGTVAALGHARGYLSGGVCPNGTSPVLKQVVAVAGDEVELQREFLAVNGRAVDHSRRLSADSIGRPLEPLPFGRRVVRDGEVWVLGVRRERSWDSRYFGPVPIASIVAKARPLLTVWAGEPK
jgi:conjugative transfer signal peptidase TraF